MEIMNEEDIDFILSHFEGQIQLFPRKMMSFISNGQFSITSKDEIFERCKLSNFIDCRINAYAEYTGYKGIIRQSPNFIFIDLDLGNFNCDINKLNLVLSKTLKKISDYQSIPTVLWTGNGYHIYLPINAIVLDQEDFFSKDRFRNLFSISGKYSNWSVSEVFLKYAEIFFTNGKADPQHRPKYKTCLIRIPNSYNSKCLDKGLSLGESKVRIIQEWNRYYLPIQLLTKEFRRWLTQEEINSRIRIKSMKKSQNKDAQSDNYPIGWIEDLLQTGIPDGRKETLRLVLGPYVAKRKSYEESTSVLQYWLEKCDKVKPLDAGFSPKQRISNSLKNIKGFLILNNLRIKNPWLYDVIQSRINIDII